MNFEERDQMISNLIAIVNNPALFNGLDDATKMALKNMLNQYAKQCVRLMSEDNYKKR